MVRTSTRRARALRTHQTDAERTLWGMLRGKQLAGYKFHRQFVISPSIVDVVCLERRLVVEVDGAQHAERAEKDRHRDRRLADEGFRVLRFSNREVLTEVKLVAETIERALTRPPP